MVIIMRQYQSLPILVDYLSYTLVVVTYFYLVVALFVHTLIVYCWYQVVRILISQWETSLNGTLLILISVVDTKLYKRSCFS